MSDKKENKKLSMQKEDIVKDTTKMITTRNMFYIISKNQFIKDGLDKLCSYNDIKLPKRATKYSAGYDFYSLCDFELHPGKSIKIPTGIKAMLDFDCFLLCVPRSSLGFKYRLVLDNTVGIIDADYIYSDNEGHIWVSLTNMSSDKTMKIKKGEAIFQGIITKYYTTDDDNTTTNRNGGFGSTNS